MRSRFLNVDYFSLTPSDSRETLTFLYLPVPCLSFPPRSTVQDHLQFRSTLHGSLHIEKLSIDDALSKFLSGVLPHRIDVDFQNFEAALPSSHNCLSSSSFGIAEARISQEAMAVFEENETENRRLLDSGADIEFSDERNTALIGKDESICDMTQFEMPELDLLLGNGCFPEEVVMQILDETSEKESNLEMLKSGLSMQFPDELLRSISLVEHINLDYFAGQNSYSSENFMPLPNLPKFGQSKFPILEVDEESLGIPTFSRMEENVGSYFDDIGPQNMGETYSVMEHKEILGGMNCNTMDFLSVYCLSKQSVVLPDMLHEMDFITILETENFPGNPALAGKSQSDMITFQEILFIDENSIQTFESFYNSNLMDDPVTSEFIFEKDFNFKDFDELIITNEIALTDDAFKSLPVPVISDYGKMRSLYVFVEERLSNLKTQPQCTSDSIYLNWDLLEEDKRNFNLYHYFQNMWAKKDLNITDFGGESFNDRKLVFDLVSLSDALDRCHIEQSEEVQNLLSDCAYQPENHTLWADSSNQLDGGSPKQGIGEQLAERNAERASLLFKSSSEVSDLDYFLNPQKATARRNCNLAVESSAADVNVLKVACTDFNDKYRHTVLQSQGWNIDLHKVLLSSNILALVGNFEKFYWAVLQGETELTQNSSMDHFQLMKLPKHKLMELHENGKNMAFVVLCAIKRAAWYLCFYGLHPTSLYIDLLCQKLEYLKLRFSFLQSLIKDENKKIGDKITLAHPALAVFDKILQSNIKQDCMKVLIVTEEVFWWSLKCLLNSMGLSFNEFHNTHANQPYGYDIVEDIDSKLKNLMNSNCLIVSYKHISPFFPFNKFGIILEYGGPIGSSRISNLSPNSPGLPHLHFLKVELDVHSAVKALCEGVEMPLAAEMSMENEIHNTINHSKTMMNPKLEKLLKFCPLGKSCDIRSSEMADDVECFAPPLSSRNPEQSHQSMKSFPETLIIVNTQNVGKEMIVSRRSTYQAILAMEKRGIQVVERDLDLPADIIISSSICLVWYDSKSLWKKAAPVTEASSSLPLCIENIATNILTLLSFSCDGCFLVFEGEVNFISTIMESSDGLYAAAASLGIDLQTLFSYSPEFTNEIIVSCINYATKLTRGLYPKMADSLTLAESFLTKFPSINSLVAHAILSTGATLTEFLGWSHEHRINVLERYHVPEESISLFSALCKYGEREDSKSIMTDCSSSVSSGPDSDKCHLYQVDYGRKRKKHIGSSEEFEPFSDELLQFEPLQETDAFLDSSNISKPCIPGKSNYVGRFTDLTKKGFSEITTMKTPSKVSQPSCDSCSHKAPLILEQKKQPSFSFEDEGLVPNDKLDTARMSKNLTWRDHSFSEKLDEDVTGEVVDLTEEAPLNKKFSFVADSENFPGANFMNFPDLMSEIEQEQIQNNIRRRLSFGKLSQPEFKSNIWKPSNHTRGEVENIPEPVFGMDVSTLNAKHSERMSDEDLAPASKRNLQGSPFQKEMSHLGGTPLSRALHSASPLKNSPWTIEFINRIKEKSRLRQKALSCHKSVSCFGYSGSTSEVVNRRPPPPPPEFFAYQGSRTENIPKHKRQKQCVQPLKPAKNGKHSASMLPTWTPNDKRATK
ncbi:protein SHORTAGE IN CHIASMATA 1 isoform X2 [Prosopis cineraria]|nr:protein SHORTAGE IN CHIASMATA 1 isoform X2 [Prosopis cineraria]